MHAHEAHGHSHGTGRVLRISLAVTMLYVVLLVVAGIRAHSLALLSEAGHNLSDFLALLLSLVAVYLEGRPPSATKTYGYRRAGVLAALVNSLSLVLVSFLIFYEAFQRLQHPVQVRAAVMIWVAAAGVAMNGAIALLLWRSGRDVNVRSALLHEVGDTLSTAAVIVGGFAILWTAQYWIDAALSCGIGALILPVVQVLPRQPGELSVSAHLASVFSCLPNLANGMMAWCTPDTGRSVLASGRPPACRSTWSVRPIWPPCGGSAAPTRSPSPRPRSR